MIRALLLSFLFLVQPGWSSADVFVVPNPTSIEISGDKFFELPVKLMSNVQSDDPDWNSHLEIVAELWPRLTSGQSEMSLGTTDASVSIRKVDDLSAEAYRLSVSESGIKVEASSLQGLSHATASLMQLVGGAKDGKIKTLALEDQPACSYRNFMIDMGRNSHSLELLKATIDLCWFYKIESIQLHLTDDQRFAFPSTAFPKLWDGLISKEQFLELDQYAHRRGVMLIPELEVPGHSGLLRNHYPDVFGKSSTDLATSNTALGGIKTLLDEMLETFPHANRIHIGGDEAFGVPEEAQRALINRLHVYLKSKGKKTVVWEGPAPGEGDNRVHPDVIHINWRTINYPADKMLENGHPVVNAAWDPLYIVDHYPRINFTMTSPQHIYETLTLETFKHVNPGIRTYANPIQVEPNEKLIGFCMPWWEGREENFFPQIESRLISFAEVAWNPKVNRDFGGFRKRRMTTEFVRKQVFFPVELKFQPAEPFGTPRDVLQNVDTPFAQSFRLIEQAILGFRLNPGVPSSTRIRYTLDGSKPSNTSMLYDDWQPLLVNKSTLVRAAAFSGGKQVGMDSRLKIEVIKPARNLAYRKPVTSNVTSGYPFSVDRVNDGDTDNLGFYLGYPADPDPVQITVDLEETATVGRIVVHAYSISNSFEKYELEVSQDGRTFVQVGTQLERPEKVERSMQYRFEPQSVRFIRIRSYGNKGYVFDSFSKIVEIQAYEE